MKCINKSIFATILIGLTACSDPLLELKPQSEATSASYYKNAKDFNTALLVVYNNLQDQVNDYFELLEYRSDNLFLSAPTAGTQDRYNLDHFTETTDNQLVLNFWQEAYAGISQCNEIISRIDGVDFDEALKARYKAEAKLLRAYNYFNIVRLWGDVPLVLSPLAPKDALSTGRTNTLAVYNAIIEDLTYATENLPASSEGDDKGRTTRYIASALLGKVFLTTGEWQKASATLNEVISSTEFQLLPNVQDVFNVGNEFNREVVFAIRFNKDIVDEGHGRWFEASDTITSTPITSALVNAYQAGDKRRKVIAFRKSGSAFVLNKFYDEPSTVTKTVGNDYILLRYADVLLMQAEALNEIGYQPTDQPFHC